MGKQAENAVRAEQLDALVRNLPVTILGGAAVALLSAVWTISDTPDASWIYPWLALFTAVTLLRFVCLKLYRNGRNRADHVRRWSVALIANTFLSGLVWFCYGYASFIPGNLPHIFFIAMVLTGLSAASMAGLSAYLPAQLAFAIPAMSGFVLQFMQSGDKSLLSLAWMSVLFLIVMALSVIQAERSLLQSIRVLQTNRLLLSGLRNSEEKMRMIVEAAPVPLLIARMTDNRVVFSNSRARDLLGDNSDVFVDPVDLAVISGEVRRLGRLRDLEVPLRDRRGQPFQALVSASPFEDQDEVALLIGLHDITRRKALEEDLRKAKTDAEAASRSKSDFLAMISHEIRTPMNGVTAMAELLAKSSLDMEQRGMVSVIRHSSDHLLTIIDDILDFSKIEAGRLLLERAPFTLRRVAEDVADMIAPRAGEKGVDVIVDISPALPSRLQGDASKLRQVLINLLGNAAKFTERGHVRLSAEADSGLLLLKVEDTGPGIPLDAQARLFQPFTQADGSVARRYGGTGLGLSISKRLIELMGGAIAIDSRPGEGTTFIVSLPLMPLPDPVASPLRLEGLTIAVNSGSRQQRTAIERILASQGASLTDDADKADLAISDSSDSLPSASSDSLPSASSNSLPSTSNDSPPGQQHTPHHRQLQLVPFYRFDADTANGWAIRKPIHAEEMIRCIEQACGRRSANPSSDAEMTGKVWHAPERSTAIAANTVILVAEDNGVNRLVITKMLDRIGMVYDVAADGQLALERLRRGIYGLVLTDFHMPRMDGLSLARAVRDLEREGRVRPVPIIALTADALPETAAICLKNGMQDFLTKPLRLDALERSLQDWLPAAFDLRQERSLEIDVI